MSTAEQESRKVLDEVGHTKVRRALAEVASKLDPAGDYRPLLDRAYELGFKPDWDGAVEFNAPVLIGDDPSEVHSIIDVEKALNEDEALALGHIDLETYQLGKRISGQAEPEEVEEEAEPEFSTMIQQFNYGWGTAGATGFNVRAWGYAPGMHNVSPFRSIRKHGVRGGMAHQSRAGRVYWRRQGAGVFPLNWSNWRFANGSSGVRWASFGFDVEAHRAEIGIGW